MASGLESKPFKGPGKKSKLEKEFPDPRTIKISLLLTGKIEKEFLTITVHFINNYCKEYK
ncbi:hypothetical protein DSO57_1032726 [Entomophthora muscae]|uniref:Uncharacterized protein n=1 Tax=Entomophthora muscae TaxID=34485 RepID=A0ACC2REZ9_9FUNG|nr:hypothetical protein DSO57_1032726 [Entomophthora muscae]